MFTPANTEWHSPGFTNTLRMCLIFIKSSIPYEVMINYGNEVVDQSSVFVFLGMKCFNFLPLI